MNTCEIVSVVLAEIVEEDKTYYESQVMSFDKFIQVTDSVILQQQMLLKIQEKQIHDYKELMRQKDLLIEELQDTNALVRL